MIAGSASLLSLIVIFVPNHYLAKAYDSLNLADFSQSYPEFKENFVAGLQVFGYCSGSYFFMLAIAILYLYWHLLAQIDSGHKLTEILQGQKFGLKLMSFLVFVSYLIGSLIFFFYGRYRDLFTIY